MSIWAEVRRQARLHHAELADSTDDLVPAAHLLAAAEKRTKIKCQSRPPNDTLLDDSDAVYSREQKRIYFSNATEPDIAVFHIAHEYAHHWLDQPLAECRGDDLNLVTPTEPEMSMVGDPDAYSPKERTEAQANLFAREFLLPRYKLYRLCRREVFDAERIARDVGVPLDLVMQQLADALLLPEEHTETSNIREEPQPDNTQIQAIEAAQSPHLVRAGPGTGKTRTLVGRVKWLVEQGIDPKTILVLTFSNFSAHDLAERICAAIGEHAAAIWIGTFHAFGFELLRKYSIEFGIPDEVNPRLLDRSGSLMLLEESLPELNLDYYLDLVDPLRKLRSILALIARAKDEAVTPVGYKEMASAMKVNGNDKECEERKKALEVAHAYAIYERKLRERWAVDFGDLIARPVELLRLRPDICNAVRAERAHILVDEYQDMNRASSLLLDLIVQPGRGPWVVGDVQQSIYRFRGASPVNMVRFAENFPGGPPPTDLGINYRSKEHIIRAFESFSMGMACNVITPPRMLKAYRSEIAGRIEFEVASTFEAECEGIAQNIISDVEVGGRFGRHAILARSHITLVRLARHLEQSGIPCLYFGDFFERDEIRDLLSLLSIVSECDGIGLFRIAQLPQYAVPGADIATLFSWRHDKNIGMLVALRQLDKISELSEAGRAALQRLADDVAHADYPMSAHRFLLHYLFRRGDHLQSQIADDTVAGQQRRLAIYQLLQFAFSFRANTEIDPKCAFLEHVRRLEILDEEKQLRQLPAAASDIDAVRMMTVHAAKGLQFPVVHIPSVTSRHFPVNRASLDQPPPGLIDTDVLMSREAEEESLFFVAMSRAEDALHLSRGVKHGGGSWAKVKHSPFLDRIKDHLPKRPDALPSWKQESLIEPKLPILKPPEPCEAWPVRTLETYLNCPRRFYYAEVLHLGGDESETPYLQFQSALRSSIAWLRKTSSPDERQAGAAARLEEDWEHLGPRGHAFEIVYRSSAEKMFSTAVSLMEGTSLPSEISHTLSRGIVVISKADHISSSSSGILVRRLKAGRLSKKEELKARHVIVQAALRQQNPQVPILFEHVSLLTGERRLATIEASKLSTEIDKLENAFTNISAGRFDPAPSDFKCPRCPYYFICPSHDASSNNL